MAIANKTGGYPFKTDFKPGALAPQLSSEYLNSIGRFLNALVEDSTKNASRSGRRVDVGGLPTIDGASAGDVPTLIDDGGKLEVVWQ